MSWLRPRPDRDAELEEELRTHVEMAVRERIARGESPEEARAHALRDFGNFTHVKEVTSEMWAWRSPERFSRHLNVVRYALRRLRSAPTFTSIAVLSLAVGIGAATTMFSVVDAMDFRDLPFRDAKRLVTIADVSPPHTDYCRKDVPCDLRRTSFAAVESWRAQSHAISEIATYQLDFEYTWNHGNDTEPLKLVEVSDNFFEFLGARPYLGRGLLPSDGAPGAAPAIVLSNDLWRSRFGGDSAIVGKGMSISSPNFHWTKVATIVGVMPPGFRLLAEMAWMPDRGRSSLPNADRDHARMLLAIGRLARGHSLDEARAEAAVFDAQRARATPAADSGWSTEVQRLDGETLTKVPAHTSQYGAGRGRMMLFGMVAVVLLVAILNVAGLFLIRTHARQHEFRIRMALGATRRRIIVEAAIESLCVLLAGGLLGVLLAFWGTRLAVAALYLETFGVPVSMSGRVLAFALILLAMAACVLGVLPVAQLPSAHGRGLLNGISSRATQARGAHRLQGLFIVGQVACTLGLLAGGSLLSRELWHLRFREPGYNPVGLLQLTVQLPMEAWRDGGRQELIAGAALDGIRRVPGVRATALAAPSFRDMSIPNRPDTLWSATVVAVSPDFFATVGTAVRRGRAFNASDADGAQRVAIIDETAARAFWPGVDPVGQLVQYKGEGDDSLHQIPVVIVGVAGRAKLWIAALAEPQHPYIYVPYAQSAREARKIVAVFARAPHASPRMLEQIRTALHAATNGPVDVTDVVLQEDAIGTELQQYRFDAIALGGFSLFALLLAAIGIYAVVALRVSQRTKEIAIRVALGADAKGILAFVMREAILLAVLGIGCGFGGGAAVAGALKTMLPSTNPRDPLVFVLCGLAVLLVIVAASFAPARSATTQDPARILQST